MTERYVILMPAGIGARCEPVKIEAAIAVDPPRLMRRICELVGDKVAIQVKIPSNMALFEVGATAYCGRVSSAKEPNILARQFLDANCIATGPVVFMLRCADGTPKPLTADADDIVALLAAQELDHNEEDDTDDENDNLDEDGLNVYAVESAQCPSSVDLARLQRQFAAESGNNNNVDDDDDNQSLVVF